MSAIAGDETPFNAFGVVKFFPLVFVEGGGNTFPSYGVVGGYFNIFDATSFALMNVIFRIRLNKYS